MLAHRQSGGCGNRCTFNFDGHIELVGCATCAESILLIIILLFFFIFFFDDDDMNWREEEEKKEKKEEEGDDSKNIRSFKYSNV